MYRLNLKYLNMKYNTLYPIILNNNKNKTFVETGFWQGHGVKVALDCGFEHVYSCDIDVKSIQLARSVYGNDMPNVHIFQKNSLQYLEFFFERYEITDGITFWLDAHPGGVGSSPVIDELNIIDKYCKNKNNIIMIDDYHILNKKWGVDLQNLNDTIYNINSEFKITISPRIYSEEGDVSDPTLPRKGELLIAKL